MLIRTCHPRYLNQSSEMEPGRVYGHETYFLGICFIKVLIRKCHPRYLCQTPQKWSLEGPMVIMSECEKCAVTRRDETRRDCNFEPHPSFPLPTLPPHHNRRGDGETGRHGDGGVEGGDPGKPRRAQGGGRDPRVAQAFFSLFGCF